MTADDQLTGELKEAARWLTFMSESDYPLEVVCWKNLTEVTPDYLRGLTDENDSAPVNTMSPAEFFRVATSEAAWKGEAELATARKFQALVRLLEDRLDGLTVYRVGRINIPVYVVGRSPSGSWLGVSTRVVET
jgi:hypothetical protein